MRSVPAGTYFAKVEDYQNNTVIPGYTLLITYQALLYEARFLGGQALFGRPIIPTALVIATLYIAMCLLLTALAHHLESRNRRNNKVRQVPDKPQVARELDATMLAAE